MLKNGWFSSKRSTEAMMRDAVNETAVVGALQGMEKLQAVFDVGMVCMKEQD